MPKDLKDLIPAIHSLFNSSEDHIPSKENLEKFKAGVEAAVTKAFRKDRVQKEGETGFKLYMSNIGQPARKLWYESRDTSSRSTKFKPEGLIKFLYGSIIEELVLLLIREAGFEVTDEQKKVEIDGVTGKLDCKIEGIPVDVKSTSTHSFKKFSQGELFQKDEFGYKAQISGYAESEGADTGAFLAFDKSTAELALLELNHLDMVPIRPLIAELKAKIASDTRPEPCFEPEPDGKSGNMQLAKPCTYCNFKEKCWSESNGGRGLRAFQYSNGIKYLTHVESEPRVDEVSLKQPSGKHEV